jgi:hypothetical protein
MQKVEALGAMRWLGIAVQSTQFLGQRIQSLRREFSCKLISSKLARQLGISD